MKKLLSSLCLLAGSMSVQATPVTGLINGGFEAPAYSARSYNI